jgi:hypothetical protein
MDFILRFSQQFMDNNVKKQFFCFGLIYSDIELSIQKIRFNQIPTIHENNNVQVSPDFNFYFIWLLQD